MTNSISFSFDWISPFWLIAFIPAIAIVIYLFTKKKTSNLFAPHIQKALNIHNQESVSIVLVLLAISWFIAIIALAGPSLFTQKVPVVESENARIIVMNMDTSMYGTDLSPNRLTRARYKILDLVASLKEGHTGVVAYAEHAYLVSPLTKDANTLKNLIESLTPDIMPDQGNNALAGVKKAIDILQQADYDRGDILLVSDTLDAADSREITQFLNDKSTISSQWRLSVLAPATTKSSPIMLANGSMQTNKLGMPMMAGQNLSALKSLAQNNHGIYKQLSFNDSDIKEISEFMQPTADFSAVKTSEDASQIEVPMNQGYLLIPILLVLALCLFRKGLIFGVILVFTISPLLPSGQSYASNQPHASNQAHAQANSADQQAEPENLSLLSRLFKNTARQGVEAFKKGFYNLAGDKFEDPAWQGLSQLKAGDHQQAIDTLTPLKDKASRFNLGAAQVHAQKLEDALQTYQSLVNDYPDDHQAKKYRDMVKLLLEQQQEQEQQDKQEQQEQSESNESNNDSNDQKNDSNDQQNKDQQQNEDQNQSSDENDQQNEEQQQDQQNSSDQGNESSSQSPDSNGQEPQPSQGNEPNDQSTDENGSDPSDADTEDNQQDGAKQPEQSPQDPSDQEQSNQEPSQQQSGQAPDGNEQAEQPQSASAGDFNTEESDERLMRLRQIPDETQTLLQYQMDYEAWLRKNSQ